MNAIKLCDKIRTVSRICIDEYLKLDSVIDYGNEAIIELAGALFEKADSTLDFIKAVYEFVRDHISHSADIGADVLTCSASEALKAGHGICFAKSHLLAALLRCKSVPAGFCYQKLILDEETAPVLIYHGLNGVYIQEYKKWIRLDARGKGTRQIPFPRAVCKECFMEPKRFMLEHIPALLWGPSSDRAYLYLHGQGGSKEYAAGFAALAVPAGWQVLSLDLPKHGERAGGKEALVPWHTVPEIQLAADWMQARYSRLALRADSLGAWFAMLALAERPLEQSLFVSPVLDMAALIEIMLGWAGVSETQLEEEGEIPTDFGQTLSWRYLCYAREHPITRWDSPTEILYAGGDHLVRRETVDAFAETFHCGLTVLEDGEHWFHTPAQLEFLDAWTKARLSGQRS